MKQFITLCLLSVSHYAAADVVRSAIHSVEEIDGKTLIRFTNGRVAFESLRQKSINHSSALPLNGDMVRAQVDDKQNLISIQTVERNLEAEKLQETSEMIDPPPYSPTIIPSLEEATTIFNRLNNNYKRSSECSNRAHVWASEEFKKNGIKSLKVFAFFTASYINRVRFKWWFHVAPAIVVQEGAAQETRVLDYMFNRGPITVKQWTDQFVFSKRACKLTTKFSEYDVNPQTEDCYMMIDSMYNWMPTDFQNQERLGKYKTEFSQSEINAAYSEAF